MKIEHNIDLKPFNTFGLSVHAKYFCRLKTEDDLNELINQEIFKENRHLILGGGSNILFTKDYDGLIIKSEVRGIKVLHEDDDKIQLEVCSGNNWHEFVMHCVDHNWGGIENLSLIPGTVGASPIQNIGAYGVEIKDVLDSVTFFDLTTGIKRTLLKHDCSFGYRESVFKHELKEKIFISSITLTLTKKNHLLNTSYGAIMDTLNANHIVQPSVKQVSDAVIQIRKSKLPDPTEIGNVGSFFKNPIITQLHYSELKKMHPSLPCYYIDNQYVKVPAGWLIEQCGWKGKKINHVGVHIHQALVLVHYGNGNGEEIFSLATEIISSVKEKFNITLTPEVNIIS